MKNVSYNQLIDVNYNQSAGAHNFEREEFFFAFFAIRFNLHF
jgi:hypothetical protein